MNATIFLSEDNLRRAGFSGFVSIRELRDCKLRSVPGEQGDIGIYLVLRVQDEIPIFLEKSTDLNHVDGKNLGPAFLRGLAMVRLFRQPRYR